MPNDRTHEPIFAFDSGEDFLPVAVESVEALDAKLVNPDGSAGGPVSLDSLPARGGRINMPPNPASYEPKMQKRFGNVATPNVSRAED